EQIKAAQSQLDQANATIADAETRIAAPKVQTDQLAKLVKERAASVYRSASNGTETNLFNIDISVLASSQKYASAATQHDNGLVEGDLAGLVAQDQAARVAQQAPKPVGGGSDFDPSRIPPASGRGGIAVA